MPWNIDVHDLNFTTRCLGLICDYLGGFPGEAKPPICDRQTGSASSHCGSQQFSTRLSSRIVSPSGKYSHGMERLNLQQLSLPWIRALQHSLLISTAKDYFIICIKICQTLEFRAHWATWADDWVWASNLSNYWSTYTLFIRDIYSWALVSNLVLSGRMLRPRYISSLRSMRLQLYNGYIHLPTKRVPLVSLSSVLLLYSSLSSPSSIWIDAHLPQNLQLHCASTIRLSWFA